jgi:sugar phosphate isomerase/epimerase
MRLGATSPLIPFSFRPETVDELEASVEELDLHGLSSIAAPSRTIEMSDDECAEFGERAAELDIVISEVHFLYNVLSLDEETREKAIQDARTLLRKADLMRARCLLGLPGSLRPPSRDRDDSGLRESSWKNPRIGEFGMCAENYTETWRSGMREAILRILDGIELTSTTYDLEPEKHCSFYQPEDCAEFIDYVGHPGFGIHLDMMNMVSQLSLYKTTDLINRTFELLGDHMHSAHLKDIRWGPEAGGGFVRTADGSWPIHVFVKMDECLIGDGELDYRTFLGHLAKMDPDFPCIVEHLFAKEEYVESISRLHRMAGELGTPFNRRTVSRVQG